MSRGRFFELVLIAGAIAVAVVHPPPAQIESVYANGWYPRIDAVLRPFVERLPFGLGDVLAIMLGLVLLRTFASLRRRPIFAVFVRFASIVSALALWFSFAWGLNYQRPSFDRKIVLHPERATKRNLDRLGDRTLRELDANVAAAHRESFSGDDAELGARLEPAFDAAIASLGDEHAFAPPRTKTTIFDGFMRSGDTAGFTDPWTHEVDLVSNLSIEERPAFYAHEWAHLAGFASEAEANYVAMLACTRSDDPLLRYSGWLLVWFNLPRETHATVPASPAVRDDILAIVRRRRGETRPAVARAQHDGYDAYLRANGVRAGYASYSGFIRWMLETS